MQYSNPKYLNVSFFYQKNYWFRFLFQAIQPFLEKNTTQIHCYYISLGQSRGDHIKLTLLVDGQKGLALAKKMDSYFKEFIKKKPSPTAISSKEPVRMYMDFSNNSIHYGIFDLIIKPHESEVFDFYYSGISKVLISLFESYQEETLDNLTEIILEMFVWFCRILSIDIDRSIKLFEELLENSYNQYEGSLLDKMRINNEENFEDNKEPIVDYIDSLFNKRDKEIRFEYEWQRIWVTTIKEVIQRLSAKGSVPIDDEDYKYLLAIITTIFAVDNESQVYYLFLNGLKEIQKVAYE